MPGCPIIVGARIPDVPDQVKQWRRDHPGQPIPDRQVFVQPTRMGPKADQRRRTIFYRYRTARAKRAMKGIDPQIATEATVAVGQTPIATTGSPRKPMPERSSDSPAAASAPGRWRRRPTRRRPSRWRRSPPGTPTRPPSTSRRGARTREAACAWWSGRGRARQPVAGPAAESRERGQPGSQRRPSSRSYRDEGSLDRAGDGCRHAEEHC